MSESRGQQRSPLKSDRGSTTVGDTVVAQVAGIAAQEVEGVQMGGGSSAAVGSFLSGVTGSISGGGNPTRGVSVEVGEEEAAVDLVMVIEYGRQIPQVVEAVRKNVINRTESLVGLRMTEVNITVNDVQIKEERPQLERQEEVKQQARQQEQRA
ncbi:MAG: Asp23/Gls24 family envelope stress response protein [Rubrobacteraceae bacterium]